jgi:hypothetical protein
MMYGRPLMKCQSGIGGSCADVYEHLIVFDDRLVDFLEFQDIR